jgi:hypothetical protein
MMIEMFTRAYVNREYRNARENILFELEKAMFPDTMPHVEIAIMRERNNAKIQENNQRMSNYAENQRIFSIVGASPELMREQIPYILEIERLKLENIVLLSQMNNSRPQKEPAREFLKRCSRNDCNGFLSTAWKCRVCELYTCKDCHEPNEPGHICNPDTVKSVQQIKSDSKPCPKCVSPIFKIYGCDQMYCTSCHTAFSWRTGQIELGRVHNPHYYEYNRQRGQLNREIGDIQCGGLPDIWSLRNQTTEIRVFHRNLLEFQQYRMPMYIIGEINAFTTNLTHRVSFLRKSIEEYAYKAELYRKDKELSKKRELGMVSTTFLQIMSDIYNRIIEDPIAVQELAAAIEYINGLFRDISNVYDCVVPYIIFPKIEIMKVK